MPSLSVRIDLEPGGRIGPGKIALLEAIDAHGSISAAGRAMGMSYRRAWELVEETNGIFGGAVAERQVGGRNGWRRHPDAARARSRPAFRCVERRPRGCRAGAPRRASSGSGRGRHGARAWRVDRAISSSSRRRSKPSAAGCAGGHSGARSSGIIPSRRAAAVARRRRSTRSATAPSTPSSAMPSWRAWPRRHGAFGAAGNGALPGLDRGKAAGLPGADATPQSSGASTGGAQ